MKKLLLAMGIVVALSGTAFAGCDSISVSGLTEAQAIDLKKKCVEIQNVTPAVDVNSMAEYAELGKKYGIALSEVAKSVGSTVNDLAQTPVGVFMLIMVAWKVMGKDLLGVVGGFVWFVTMLPLWVYMFKRLVLSTRNTREKLGPDGKVTERLVEPVNYNGPAGPITFLMGCFFLFICVSGFIMVF